MAESLHIAPSALLISEISIHVQDSSKWKVKSAEVHVNRVQRRIASESKTPFRQILTDPLEVGRSDSLSVRIDYKKTVMSGHSTICFDTSNMFRVFDEGRGQEKQEYREYHGKFEIILGLSVKAAEPSEQGTSQVSPDGSSKLRPTTEEIIHICPRFRILVIGKTGVGKSSLINHAFGVQDARAAHDMPGEADINTEFISMRNDRFVLHDSKGFEQGEEDNLDTVLKFIKDRGNMREVKDKLHAIWLCFEIPRAGGRLLEVGSERFLSMKRNGDLENIPVVVVFTKYDKFVNRIERTICMDDAVKQGKDVTIEQLAKSRAEDELRDICISPIQTAAGNDIPHAAVSISKDPQYKQTLENLLQLTYDEVSKHVADAASTMASVAQRVSPKVKIQESIKIGKKKYWRSLASSTAFANHTIWDCLYVLHDDIVNIWNFNDPHHYLVDKQFRQLMVTMVHDLDPSTSPPNPLKTATAGLSVVASIAGILGAVAASGPAIPIVLPIAMTAVVTAWAYAVYKQSKTVVPQLMAYIVNLTNIMQILFFLTVDREEGLPKELVLHTFSAYNDSVFKAGVHEEISKFDVSVTIRGRDAALEKISELLEQQSVRVEEIARVAAEPQAA